MLTMESYWIGINKRYDLLPVKGISVSARQMASMTA